MRLMFTNTAPVSVFAPTGACTVTPVAARLRAVNPAAVAPVTARPLPMTRQDQSAQSLIMTAKHGYTPVLETNPGSRLGGFRGVPPRSKQPD